LGFFWLFPSYTALALARGVLFLENPPGDPRPPRCLTRAGARAALGIPQDAFVVGTVARLVRQKRIDRLLHAVAAEPHIHVVVTGDGALRAELEDLAATLHIHDRTHFTGARDDTGSVLAALDAFSITSDQEGMSSAMLEALAAGVPVISTAVSGAGEVLLGDPRCGIVVDHDGDGLVQAMTRLRADPELRQSLAAAASCVAADRYSLAAMTIAWERLLRRTVAAPR
jgi:glycosyltransferase involved in cell wall biosynthesis